MKFAQRGQIQVFGYFWGEHFYDIGQIFIVVNGQMLIKLCRYLVAL